jgi:hypothetical protein
VEGSAHHVFERIKATFAGEELREMDANPEDSLSTPQNSVTSKFHDSD